VCCLKKKYFLTKLFPEKISGGIISLYIHFYTFLKKIFFSNMMLLKNPLYFLSLIAKSIKCIYKDIFIYAGKSFVEKIIFLRQHTQNPVITGLFYGTFYGYFV
jgi:hypothetical protein